MTEEIRKLKEIIDGSDNIVFFGGAGVSTESGIPDFRSVDGLYNQSLGEYNAKKNGLQSQLSSLQQAENSAYNTYQQNLSNWYDGLEYWQNEYNNAYNADQQKKANDIQTATGIGQMIATAAPWIIKAIMMLL